MQVCDRTMLHEMFSLNASGPNTCRNYQIVSEHEPVTVTKYYFKHFFVFIIFDFYPYLYLYVYISIFVLF